MKRNYMEQEILKLTPDGRLTMAEIDYLQVACNSHYKFYDDRANGYVAFKFSGIGRSAADAIVDVLNGIWERDKDFNPDQYWLLGSEDEEYVDVN